MVKVMEQNNGDHQDDDVDTCNEMTLTTIIMYQ